MVYFDFAMAVYDAVIKWVVFPEPLAALFPSGISFNDLRSPWVISSTFLIVQILVHWHFDLVSSLLALEATKTVTEPVTEMALELIYNHIISVRKREKPKSYILFYVTIATNKFWNDSELMLKSFWTSHLQIMNGLEPLF